MPCYFKMIFLISEKFEVVWCSGGGDFMDFVILHFAIFGVKKLATFVTDFVPKMKKYKVYYCTIVK